MSQDNSEIILKSSTLNTSEPTKTDEFKTMSSTDITPQSGTMQTFQGTVFNDLLQGTEEGDNFKANDGDDIVHGFGGEGLDLWWEWE